MAIDDNTLYGVTGAQVKDLASKVKKGKSTIFYLDKTKDFWHSTVPAQKTGTTQVFADPENTVVVTGGDVLAASEKGAVFLGVPNASYGSSGRYDIYPAAFISNGDEWDIYYIVSKYPSSMTNGVIGIQLDVFGNSSTTFDWRLTLTGDEQVDWNDNVQESPYYIKHKPIIVANETTQSSSTDTVKATSLSGSAKWTENMIVTINMVYDSYYRTKIQLDNDVTYAIDTAGSTSGWAGNTTVQFMCVTVLGTKKYRPINRPKASGSHAGPLYIQDNLTTTNQPQTALCANQGKVLKDLIDATSANTPVITLTATDPGEGATLAENHFIGVY